MGLELTKQIYGKPPSTPLTSWIFRVKFYYLGANGLQNDFQYQLNQPADISSIPIKADLPKFETKYYLLISFLHKNSLVVKSLILF